MTIKYKGYEIWTERTGDGFRATVRRIDRAPMIWRILSRRPANRECSTMENFYSEAAAISEVKTWINHGTLE